VRDAEILIIKEQEAGRQWLAMPVFPELSCLLLFFFREDGLLRK